MPRSFSAFIFLCLCFSIAFGQERKIKLLPIPAIGYSPETRTYVGAVTLFTLKMYDDSLTRTSNVKFEFNYTWNKQIILESAWNYFFREEKWFTAGEIHYPKYPDYYYGVGPDTPESNKLIFNSTRMYFEAFVLKNIGRKIFTGLNLKYESFNKVRPEADAPVFQELIDGNTFAIGYAILKDTRNNLLTPERGYYLFFNTSYNFSEANYVQASLDMRYYKTWSNKFTLANRLFNKFNFGTPPFYDYAFLGGDRYVRGYYFGRFRDNDLGAWQTEFRMPVVGMLGIAAFGGLSNIYSPENPFSLSKTKYNCGLGFRIRVDKTEKTNLRVDYAMGKEGSSGFYIAFGESF